MRYLRKRVNKPLEILNTNEIYCSNLAEKHIDNTLFDKICLDGKNLFMYVDEEGGPKQLPLNLWTGYNIKEKLFAQPILGDVVFIRRKPCSPYDFDIYDYEIEDITSEDIKMIKELLSEKYQDFLYFTYICEQIANDGIDFNNLKQLYEERTDF